MLRSVAKILPGLIKVLGRARRASDGARRLGLSRGSSAVAHCRGSSLGLRARMQFSRAEIKVRFRRRGMKKKNVTRPLSRAVARRRLPGSLHQNYFMELSGSSVDSRNMEFC